MTPSDQPERNASTSPNGRWLQFSRKKLLLVGTACALAVFANWPRDLGVLAANTVEAGFPRTYAVWRADGLQEFDLLSLAIDLVVAVVFVIGVAVLLPATQTRVTP